MEHMYVWLVHTCSQGTPTVAVWCPSKHRVCCQAHLHIHTVRSLLT